MERGVRNWTIPQEPYYLTEFRREKYDCYCLGTENRGILPQTCSPGMVGGEGDAAPRLVEGRRVVPFLSSLTTRCFVRLQATDTDHGAELWRTDGTGPGTVLVKDIYPGERSGGPTFMTPFGGYLFFQVTYWWNPDTIQLLPNRCNTKHQLALFKL